jgi:hypothetical protein
MKVYIDSEFKCHTGNPSGNLQEIETDFFDGKCGTFVEGYRFGPEGTTWERSDGEKFQGVMITPCKPYGELAAAQTQYEADQAELAAAYLEGVNSI